jgi:hypothetical protein
MRPLGKSVNISVSLFQGRVFEADLDRELSINTHNIREELLNQPAKYAWWSTLLDLAEIKVKKISTKLSQISRDDKCFDEYLEQYVQVCKQYELLYFTQKALNHKKDTLLKLWDNPTETGILSQYYQHLSSLRAIVA